MPAKSSTAIQCMRCQAKTGTSGLHRSGNAAHPRIAGRCVRCGANKSKFVRKGHGFFGKLGGFLKKAASNPIVQSLAQTGIQAGLNALSGGASAGSQDGSGIRRRSRRRGRRVSKVNGLRALYGGRMRRAHGIYPPGY